MTIDKIDNEDLKNILQDIKDEGYYLEIKNIKSNKIIITICNVGTDGLTLPINYDSIKDLLSESIDRLRESKLKISIEIERGFKNIQTNQIDPFNTLKMDEVPDSIDLKYQSKKGGGMDMGPEMENIMKEMIYGNTKIYLIVWINIIIEKTIVNKIKKFFDFK